MLKPVSHHLPNDLPHSVSYSVSHRQLQRTQPALNILQDVALQKTRVHECCGQARVFFAMLVAAKVEGPVFWIAPKWQRDHLNPDGMRPYVKPQNFTFINPDRPEDTLWAMEEALRCGAVPLVVADLPTPPSLTAVRRLHLAAENNTGQNASAPLGLLLTHGDGGAPGVESRWHMVPAHSPTAQCWHLTRTRARTAPVKQWMVAKTRTGLKTQPHPMPPTQTIKTAATTPKTKPPCQKQL
jgi:protein ImuA